MKYGNLLNIFHRNHSERKNKNKKGLEKIIGKKKYTILKVCQLCQSQKMKMM